MNTRQFTRRELAVLGVPPDSPDDIAHSDALLADEFVAELKYTALRRCVFRADDGHTYAVEYQAPLDPGDYETGAAPDGHGWYGDTIDAIEVEQQLVVTTHWTPAQDHHPRADHATDNELLREAADRLRSGAVVEDIHLALADLLDDLADGDDEGHVNPWAAAVARQFLGGGAR